MVIIMHAVSVHDSFRWMTSPYSMEATRGRGRFVPMFGYSKVSKVLTYLFSHSVLCVRVAPGKVRIARMEMQTRRHMSWRRKETGHLEA